MNQDRSTSVRSSMEQEPAEPTREGASRHAAADDNNNNNALASPAAKLESLFVSPPQTEEDTSAVLRDPLLLSTRDDSSSPSSSSSSLRNGGNDNDNALSRWRRRWSFHSLLWRPLFRFLRRHGWWSDERRRYFRELIRRSGNYLAYATLLTTLMILPNIIYRGKKDDRIDKAAFKSARVMVITCIVLSFRQVYLHLTHWYMPQVQKYVVSQSPRCSG